MSRKGTHTKVQARIRARIDPDRAIQWHLHTTKYDRSPCCDAEMGWLRRFTRICLAEDCDRVWTESTEHPKEDSHGS